MFRRISLSHPHRPHLHLLVAIVALIIAAVVVFFAVRSAGAADVVELKSGRKCTERSLADFPKLFPLSGRDLAET